MYQRQANGWFLIICIGFVLIGTNVIAQESEEQPVNGQRDGRFLFPGLGYSDFNRDLEQRSREAADQLHRTIGRIFRFGPLISISSHHGPHHSPFASEPMHPVASPSEPMPSGTIERDESQLGPEVESFNPSVVVVDKPIERDVVERPYDEDEARPMPSPGLMPFGPFAGVPSPFDWPGMFSYPTYKPWWKGPNVCEERTVIEGDENEKANTTERESVEKPFESLIFSLQTSSCTDGEIEYKCVTKTKRRGETKTTVVKYSCCYGHARSNSGPRYCTKVEMKDMIETLEGVGAKRMAELIKSHQLDESLVSKNVTIFAPSDGAFLEYQDAKNNDMDNEVMEPHKIESESDSNMVAMLEGHIVNGTLRTTNFIDEQVLESMNGESKIRINEYRTPQRVFTANCARILATNVLSKNGLVHVVDRVLPVPTKSVMEIIKSRPDLSRFKDLLVANDMVSELEDLNGNWTIFAPSNSALEKMDPELLGKLENGKRCAKQILKSHIVPNVVCSSIIPTRAQLKSMSGTGLLVERSPDDKLYVNENQLMTRDALATNGIVYTMDGFIVPRETRRANEALQEHNMDQFWRILNETGLAQELDQMENMTIFVPMNAAIESLSEDQLERIKNDTSILKYHVATPKTCSCDMKDNLQLDSMEGKKLRINLYEDFPGFISRATVGCANIIKLDNKICNGEIHLIDRVIYPPHDDLLTALETMESHRLLRDLLSGTELESELRNATGLTLLAPSDNTFHQQLSENEIKELLNNKSKADQLLRKHVLTEPLCCSGIGGRTASIFSDSFNIRRIDGSAVAARRDFKGDVRFDRGTVTRCDIVSQNGIIHVIDRVFKPVTERRRNPFTPFFEPPFFLFK